jgi:hypothetical protein
MPGIRDFFLLKILRIMKLAAYKCVEQKRDTVEIIILVN